MHKTLVALAILFPLAAAAAPIVEHCPAPKAIVDNHGVYHAPARDPQFQWAGIPAPGNSGTVERFDEAIFYPDDEDSSEGELARCSYKLARGMLDMTYQNASGRPKSQLHDRNAWTREYGPFRIPYDACRAGDGTACMFHIVKD